MTLVIRGMYGVGDCLHQRAIMRDLLRRGQSVVLQTFYWSMYEDLIDLGLQLRLIGGVMPRIRDRNQGKLARQRGPIHNPTQRQITYKRETILEHGSILAAQYKSIGMQMPVRPDFSMPVPEKWKDEVLSRLHNPLNKPIMMYRPSVLNDVWLSEARSPDPRVYRELYEFVRDTYFVVGVANLGNKGERIDGDRVSCNAEFYRGELDFELIAGLFAVADVTFTCPGFAPVLSQAVCTPTIITYGGNESFATTNSVGAHLAPTLAIEPINPCACHLKKHDCDKTTDVEKAKDDIARFLNDVDVHHGRLSACAS